MQVDNERIANEILATGVSSLPLEYGSILVEHWIAEGVCADKRIVAVECGFVLQLDENTYVIGVQDLLTDENGTVGNEWKTTKEKTKYWNSEKWFESISTGSQVAIYALALQCGTYYEKATGHVFNPQVRQPRIRVRAISKSDPPVLWPTEGDGVLTFCQKDLNRTRDALLAKAASIRAMQRASKTPWQLPGIWCTNQFRRTCEHHADCLAGKGPEGYAIFAENDPAFALAMPHIKGCDLNKLVVLSASSYSTASECVEKYRRATLSSDAEESEALDVGTVVHAGVAEYYRQIRESQVDKRTIIE